MTTSAYDNEEFMAFVHAECDCISKDKWIEGIKIHSDPGNGYVLKWVSDNSQEFRDKWNASSCRLCVSAFDCGHYLRISCSDFIQREKRTPKPNED